MKSCLMAQGLAEDRRLEAVRDRLRTALRRDDLGAGLDERYWIRTAHATIMRFRTQPQDLSRLVSFLSGQREQSFGQFAIANPNRKTPGMPERIPAGARRMENKRRRPPLVPRQLSLLGERRN